VCHCRNCQRRSGSAFAVQARWPDAAVALSGAWREWTHVGESGARATFRFCPTCGGTLAYASDAMPGLTAVAVGGFADPSFPAPTISVYEERKHPWLDILGEAVEHWE
jgi:hypothetical protein